MIQSLTQLPKTAKFRIGGWGITIQNHKVKYPYSLFDCILDIIMDPRSDRQMLYQFEGHGISWEMIIEECVRELEEDTDVFAHSLNRYNNTWVDWAHSIAFSESVAGRKIAGLLVEKIRSCDNWDDLYDEMQRRTKFHKDMRKRINKELKKQDKAKEEMTHGTKFDTTAKGCRF